MYRIIIASSIYRENLVAELWYDDDLLLEINQENPNGLSIQLYKLNSKSITLDLKEFTSKIEEARMKLVGA